MQTRGSDSSGLAGAPQPPAARNYSLFVTEGAPRRFVWRFRDEGASLTAETIEWRLDGAARLRDYREIESVHLVSSHLPSRGSGGGDIYQCTIRFRDGLRIMVHSLSERGFPDPSRAGPYREFVQLLHSRLARPGFEQVRFEAGVSSGRALGQKIAIGAAGLLFVALPLGLLIVIRSWQPLLIMGVGVALVWPLWKTARTNRPRTYSARDLPHDLLP